MGRLGIDSNFKVGNNSFPSHPISPSFLSCSVLRLFSFVLFFVFFSPFSSSPTLTQPSRVQRALVFHTKNTSSVDSSYPSPELPRRKDHPHSGESACSQPNGSHIEFRDASIQPRREIANRRRCGLSALWNHHRSSPSLNAVALLVP